MSITINYFLTTDLFNIKINPKEIIKIDKEINFTTYEEIKPFSEFEIFLSDSIHKNYKLSKLTGITSDLIIKEKTNKHFEVNLKFDLINFQSELDFYIENYLKFYLSNYYELDAYAREYYEFYKRKFPNQNFNLEKFKTLPESTTDKIIFLTYFSILNSNKPNISKKFLSKIASANY